MKKTKVNKHARKVDIQEKKSTKIWTIKDFKKIKRHGMVRYTIINDGIIPSFYTKQEALDLCVVNNYGATEKLSALVSISLFTQMIIDIQKIKKSLKIK